MKLGGECTLSVIVNGKTEDHHYKIVGEYTTNMYLLTPIVGTESHPRRQGDVHCDCFILDALNADEDTLVVVRKIDCTPV